MRRNVWTRVVGACTMALMAHLSLVGSDLVCASHAGSHSAMTHKMSTSSPTNTDEMQAGAMREPMAAAPKTSAGSAQAAMDGVPCQVPSTDHCCDAMTGCAITLAAIDVANALPAPTSDAGVAAAAALAPPSRLTAPESPPPKA